LSTALVRELVALAGAGIGGGADLGAEATTEAGKKVAAATLRLVDAHHPAAASAAVDAVLSENAAASASAAQRNGSAQSNGAAQSNGGKKGGKGKKEEAGGAAAFLREALSGSAAGPMPGHAASLGAALDHPQAGLREAALRELRQGGAGAKVMAGGVNGSNKKKGAAPIPGVLSGALLRRVSDDVPRVAAAAASLPGLRAAVGDDEALFSAASERLAAAAQLCAGKTPEAEAERAVAKRCVKLACGVLATPFPSKKADAADDDSEEEIDSEEDDSEDEGEGAGADGMGNLAGRAATLALGYLMFSPATRAVARACLAAVKRNSHPALAGLHTQSFDDAVAAAQEAGGGPASSEPTKKASGKGKASAAAAAASNGDGATTQQQKEARARSDAAANRVIIGALADGILAWGGEQGLSLWTREAWRDGTPRARATLMLALRDAVSRSSKSSSSSGGVRKALWALLRETWREEGVGAGIGEIDDGEVAALAAAEDPATPAVLRAMSRNSPRALPVLARSVGLYKSNPVDPYHSLKAPGFIQPFIHEVKTRFQAFAFICNLYHYSSALIALIRATNTNSGKSAATTAEDAKMLEESFALMATSDRGGGFAPALDALLAASERGGVAAAAFLGSRAAADPDDADAAEVPRTALTLLARRGGSGASASLLSVLVVACTAAEPTVRIAAAEAIVALSGGAKKSSKGGVAALWSALRDAAAQLGGKDGKSVDARAVLCDALAAGLNPKATGSAAESEAALAALLAPVAACGDGSAEAEGEVRLGAYGGRRLVAALKVGLSTS
jgi:hypothetical protein